MNKIEVKNISHKYDDGLVLEDVNLTVGEGEVVCLLGPSGCGKSTLLRVIAGLETPVSGEVLVNGEKMTGQGTFIPPEKRNIGMVFQAPALFPHMTVLKNVIFGIRGKKSREDCRNIAMQRLDMVGMADMAERFPHQLSGGEQQRVALARALAPEPQIMLLDEPFANLDSILRKQVRRDTMQLLQSLGIVVLLVTHDPEEALHTADRIYVMQSGRIVQSGLPEELYLRPKNKFVAGFFGELNEIDIIVRGGEADTPFGKVDIREAACHNVGNEACEDIADGTEAKIYIRPEALLLVNQEDCDIEAVVEDVKFLGITSVVGVRLADGKRLRLRSSQVAMPRAVVGERVFIKLDRGQVFIFGKE